MCGPHLNSPADLVGMPIFPEGTNSVLSKVLTKEMWESYNGSTNPDFQKIIFAGCKYPTEAAIGIYAQSP